MVRALVQVNEVGTTVSAWYRPLGAGEVTAMTGGWVSMGMAATVVVPSGAVILTTLGPSPVTVTVHDVVQVWRGAGVDGDGEVAAGGAVACTVVGSGYRPLAPAPGLTRSE